MRSEQTPRVPRRRRVALCAVVVSGLLAVPLASALPAGAQSIESKRAEAAAVASELASLDRELMDINARYEASRYELSEAEEKVTEAQARVDQTNAELEQRRGEMRTFAVKAYQSGNDSPELNALLTADGDTAPAKKSYIEVTNGNRHDLVDSLSGMQRQAEDETKRAPAGPGRGRADRRGHGRHTSRRPAGHRRPAQRERPGAGRAGHPGA